MPPLTKHILTDEQQRPIAVQIPYEQWLEVEKKLGEPASKESAAFPSEAEKVLRRTAGTWKLGDGLDYQRRIRAEWDER